MLVWDKVVAYFNDPKTQADSKKIFVKAPGFGSLSGPSKVAEDFTVARAACSIGCPTFSPTTSPRSSVHCTCTGPRTGSRKCSWCSARRRNCSRRTACRPDSRLKTHAERLPLRASRVGRTAISPFTGRDAAW